MKALTKTYKRLVPLAQAAQYTEEHRMDIIMWTGAQHRSIDDDGAEYELRNLRLPGHLKPVCPGDWIVRETGSDFVFYSDAAFHKLFSEV